LKISSKHIVLILFVILPLGRIAAQDSTSIFNRTVQADFDSLSVYECLVSLSQQIDYHFSYDAGIVPSSKTITLHQQSIRVSEILKKLFPGKEVTFRVIGKQIVIFRKEQKFSDNRNDIEIYPYTSIKGRVVDKKTRDPLPFASVSVVGKNTGTITNDDGEFVLKIPREMNTDTIGISSMGYKTFRIPVSSADTAYAIYPLSMEFIPIQEVIIRKADPLGILRAAIKAIPKNYSEIPSVYTSFYREAVEKNDRYAAMSEAILNIYSFPYDRPDQQNLVKVFKSRKMYDANMLDTVILKLKGGIYTCLLLDLARNQAEFMQEEYFHSYRYNMADIVYYDENPTYVVEFAPKADNEALFKGRIYIDINTLAIRGADFSISPSRIKYAANNMVLKKSRGMKVKTVNATYMVRYRQVGGKFYLNHIRFETWFKIRRKGKIFSNDFRTFTELATNNIDTTRIKKFRFRELTRTDEVFFDQINSYDPEFWGHLNYIKPDEPIEEALKRINKILIKPSSGR
jgi:hypothetical protein